MMMVIMLVSLQGIQGLQKQKKTKKSKIWQWFQGRHHHKKGFGSFEQKTT
jgi:hypothetical protein